MEKKLPDFIKMDGDKALFNKEGYELCYYIPEEYFKTNIATTYGAYISSLGIFNYTIRNIDTNKNNGLHVFRVPTVFLCKPRAIEKLSNVKLTKESEVGNYRVLRFRIGDEAISSIHVPEIVDNATLFFQALCITAKIPNTIPYNTLQELIPENLNANGADYGMNMQMYGLVISELARDPEHLDRPFRLAKGKSMTDYKLLSVKRLPNYISPFDSITSENFDLSMMAAITMDKNEASPLERILAL